MSGLRVWDASGNLIFDTSTSIARSYGTFTTGTGTTGSYTDNNLDSSSTVWFAVSAVATQGEYSPTPSFSVSGKTISWTWSDTPQNMTVCYGTY